MKLNWDSRLDLAHQNVIFHSKNSISSARVTIGMPTYRRGSLIDRALASIASQTYRDFTLLISDNNGVDPKTISAVQSISKYLPEVYLLAQDHNIGALNKFKFLVALSETQYFMWLSDDDEISPDYLDLLVKMLDSDPCVVTAMGGWMSMSDSTYGAVRPQVLLNPLAELDYLNLLLVHQTIAHSMDYTVQIPLQGKFH